MSSNFDWRTEEDERAPTGWDEPMEQKPTGRPQRRAPWRMIALIAVLVITVGAIVWWRVDKRIEETMQAFRTDVIASHNLVQQAVLDGDEEVFRSFLSGRDPAWTESIMETFRSRLLIDRTPLGMVPVQGSLPATLPPPDAESSAGERAADIVFSPDLNEATVTIDQPYHAQQGTVVLQQTLVYRRGDNRWLLAPPLEDQFWGEWVTTNGDYLNVIYPSRDEVVAERLASDLDDEISRLCATLERLDCSADLRLTVRLDSDPATLAAMTRLLGPLRQAREREDILELPAPTLVGLPVGGDEAQQEAGYRALRDGYARYLLGAVIAQVTGWQCCEESVLLQLLLEYQLGELGLVPWSFGESDYRRVLDSRLRLTDMRFLISADGPAELSDEQLWQSRAALDFLINGLGVSVADLQRIAGQTQNLNGFINRVQEVVEPSSAGWPPANLDLAWWFYALDATQLPVEPSDPFAVEDLYLSCQATDGQQPSDLSRLLRYQSDESQWTEVYNRPGFIWMSALPDPGMMLMQEFAYESEMWHTGIWRDELLSPAYSSAGDRYSISLGQTDSAGRQLIIYTIEGDDGVASLFKLDLDNCDSEGCAQARLPGMPTWSPDGSRAIYAGEDGATDNFESVISTGNQRYLLLDTSGEHIEDQLFLGPGDAEFGAADLHPIASGRSPFWIDNQTYGYIEQGAYIEQAEGDEPVREIAEDVVVLSTLADNTAQPLISASDLAQFLPQDDRFRSVRLGYVATNTALPQTLFIVLLDELEQRAYLFSYDLVERAPQLRMDLLYRLGHSLGFSPDGRFLIMTGSEGPATSTSPSDEAILLVHNFAENRTIPFITQIPFFLPSVGYDWSEDSRWLAIVHDDNLIGLIDPREGHVRLLPHNFGACTSVAWLKP